jgi:tetratricopeptide (TPR) repeat protein
MEVSVMKLRYSGVFLMLFFFLAASCVAGQGRVIAQSSDNRRIAIENALAGKRSMNQGNYRKAIQFYNKAIALYKHFSKEDLSRIYVERAFCLAGTGQYQRSLDDSNWAVEKDPRNPGAYFQRGTILTILKGDPSAGLDDIKKAIRLDPDNEEYKEAMKTYLQAINK